MLVFTQIRQSLFDASSEALLGAGVIFYLALSALRMGAIPGLYPFHCISSKAAIGYSRDAHGPSEWAQAPIHQLE